MTGPIGDTFGAGIDRWRIAPPAKSNGAPPFSMGEVAGRAEGAPTAEASGTASAGVSARDLIRAELGAWMGAAPEELVEGVRRAVANDPILSELAARCGITIE